MTRKDFGIIITTYSGDFYLTKALLASIKKFMPQVSICIIQDGSFSLEEVKRVYNIQYVIRKEDVKNEFLRDNCFESRCCNLVAFWESPYEKFLYLDSDTVLWGDILKNLNLDGIDFFYNEPHEAYSDEILKEQYFDYDRLFKYVEDFDWRRWHYFNSGVFIGRRNMFEWNEFKAIIQLWKQDKTLLPTDPQSILNVLVFKKLWKGEITVQETHLQTIVPVISIKELNEEITFSGNGPLVKKDTVLHWAGDKPLMTNKGKVFIAPELYFRKQHLKNIGSLWRFLPTVYFMWEEFKSILDQYYQGSVWNYLKRKIRNYLNNLNALSGPAVNIEQPKKTIKTTDFGIVITTYAGDFFLTKGLLASIKKFMPDVPICIIQDGNFSLEEVRRVYNIQYVIKRENVKDEFLRTSCFGSRCTTMIAFWESPFEKFLYLDSDLVLWGNILKHIDLSKQDVVHNEPHEPYSNEIYKKQYFDYDRLFNFMEPFDWRGCHFFNGGVFIATRGILDLEKFKKLYYLWRKDKSLMPAEPQGMINYLVFYLREKAGLKVSEAHMQTIVPVFTQSELENKFTFAYGEPVVKQDTIIHWAGTKPLLMNKGTVFEEPEYYFRKQHLKNIASFWRFMPGVHFSYEEYKSILDRYHQGSVWVYLSKKIEKLFTKN